MYNKLFRQLGTIIVVLLIPIIPFAITGELPGEQWLSAADGNALLFGLAGGGLLVMDVLLPVPSSIVGTLLGARLGLLPGFAAIWVGLTAGNVIGYLLGRLTLRRLRGELPELPTLLVVFLSRPVPVLAEATSLAAGASAMPLPRFILACGAGNLVYAGMLAGNGASLVPGILLGPGIVVPMLLPMILWAVWRVLARGPGRRIGSSGT